MKQKFVDCNDGLTEYLSGLTEGTSTQRRHGNEISDGNWNDKNWKLQCNRWVTLKGLVRIPRKVMAINSTGEMG